MGSDANSDQTVNQNEVFSRGWISMVFMDIDLLLLLTGFVSSQLFGWFYPVLNTEWIDSYSSSQL